MQSENRYPAVAVLFLQLLAVFCVKLQEMFAKRSQFDPFMDLTEGFHISPRVQKPSKVKREPLDNSKITKPRRPPRGATCCAWAWVVLPAAAAWA